jgi:hypothetical protein
MPGPLADLKANAVSPVAPTLQLLLTRMWAEARDRDRDRPVFDRPLYAALKERGFQLGEVLDQQLTVISGSDPEAVRTRLVLDLLDYFATPLGTATTRTREEVVARYPRQNSDRLDALLGRCQDCYLLAEVCGNELPLGSVPRPERLAHRHWLRRPAGRARGDDVGLSRQRRNFSIFHVHKPREKSISNREEPFQTGGPAMSIAQLGQIYEWIKPLGSTNLY